MVIEGLIKDNDFCEIVVDHLNHDGLHRGNIVYVAGHQALPISEEDPYTQRIKFFVHPYDHINKKMIRDLFPLDPKSIVRLNDERQKVLIDEYKEVNGIN